MTVYGYVRVSSKDQNIERQMAALIEAGVTEEKIFIDEKSGKSFDREQYQALKKKLVKGDVLIIKELDRLGRNAREMKLEWEYYRDNEIDIAVLDMPILDTRGKNDTLREMLQTLVFDLLSYIAQMEREKISQRQKEGVELAKQRGVYKGRVKKYHDKNEGMNYAVELFKNRDTNEMTVKKICEITKVSRSALYRRTDELGIQR